MRDTGRKGEEVGKEREHRGEKGRRETGRKWEQERWSGGGEGEGRWRRG